MCKITGSGSGEGHFLIYSWHFLCASSCDGIQSEALKERKRERKREREKEKEREREREKSFSCVRLFVTPWAVCSLPGSSDGICQARVLD